MDYPEICARAFDTPLMVETRKAQAFVAGFGHRLLGGVPEVIGGTAELPDATYRTAKPFASLLDQSLRESIRSGDRSGYAVRDGVAVVPITGVLVHRGSWIGRSSGQTSYEGVGAVLQAAAEDHAVRAIALEIDSFGGEVAGCFDLANLIREVRSEKPVRAFVAEHAYSAAYALASQADRIVLPATGGVGSIGVICMHADFSRNLEETGIKVTLIHAGEHKADGNPYEPLPDDVRDRLQAEMETLRTMFAETVGQGRGDRLSAAGALATEAQCYLGGGGVEAGLADRVAAPRAAFEEFVAEVNGRQAAGSTLRSMQPSKRRSTMDTPTKDSPAEDTAAPEGQQAQLPAEPPAATENGAADAARGSERDRISSIMNSSNASALPALAKHLAFETDLSAEAAEGILKAAAEGSAGKLAVAMAGDDTEIDTPSSEAKAGPRPVDAVKRRFGT